MGFRPFFYIIIHQFLAKGLVLGQGQPGYQGIHHPTPPT